jgi:hypothetical protein
VQTQISLNMKDYIHTTLQLILNTGETFCTHFDISPDLLTDTVQDFVDRYYVNKSYFTHNGFKVGVITQVDVLGVEDVLKIA